MDSCCNFRHLSYLVCFKSKSRYITKSINKNFFNNFSNDWEGFFYPISWSRFLFSRLEIDPILQFACALLAGGIAVEMVPSFIDDYQGWRKRTGRATAAIVVDSQPDDSAEENK